jgi:hypothetical protein
MANEIASLETVELEGEDGPVVAIMVALNMTESDEAPAFVRHVAEKVLQQRMISPPETSMLLVTLIGPKDSAAFEQEWRKAVAVDPALAHFLSQMVAADGVLGTSKGELLAEFPLR